MHKLNFILFTLVGVLTLSAFQIATPARVSTAQQLPDAILYLQTDFAEYLGVPVEEVLIDDYDPLTWEDSCLGSPTPDEICEATTIEGYAVGFNTIWGEYQFHLDTHAEAFRLVDPLPLSNNEYPVILWQRQGDPAPVCLRLVRALDSRYVLLDCAGEDTFVLSTGELDETEEEIATRLAFYETYAPVHWVTSPPAPETELYLDSYIFNGQGEEELDAQQQADLNAAQVEWMAYLMENAITPTPNPGKTAIPPSPISNTGIEGYITIGPMCPVVILDSPCPDAPYQATLSILNARGVAVASVQSDATGYYQVSLEPGSYLIHPESPDGFTQAPEQIVEVVAGQMTRADVVYDSGIR